MTTASTTDHRRRAASPSEAVARQRALAAADCQALYDFTTAVCPLAFTQPVLAKSTSIRARTPVHTLPAATDVRAIIAAADALVVDLSRRFRASSTAVAEHRRRLEALLTLQRLRVFRVDFRARRRFAPLVAGTCLLCGERRQVAAFRCCRTPTNEPAVCVGCLERSAFFSSLYGTRADAECPFCKTAYPVYAAAGRAPKRKRE